jgi:hypothetical protein
MIANSGIISLQNSVLAQQSGRPFWLEKCINLAKAFVM